MKKVISIEDYAKKNALRMCYECRFHYPSNDCWYIDNAIIKYDENGFPNHESINTASENNKNGGCKWWMEERRRAYSIVKAWKKGGE